MYMSINTYIYKSYSKIDEDEYLKYSIVCMNCVKYRMEHKYLSISTFPQLVSANQVFEADFWLTHIPKRTHQRYLWWAQFCLENTTITIWSSVYETFNTWTLCEESWSIPRQNTHSVEWHLTELAEFVFWVCTTYYTHPRKLLKENKL